MLLRREDDFTWFIYLSVYIHALRRIFSYKEADIGVYEVVFLVEFLNITYQLWPNPLRKYYLRCFGIKVGHKSSIHRKCKFFHVGKITMGERSVINFGCYLDNRRGIRIGSNVGIAHNTKIYTLGHNIESPHFETKGA